MIGYYCDIGTNKYDISTIKYNVGTIKCDKIKVLTNVMLGTIICDVDTKYH